MISPVADMHNNKFSKIAARPEIGRSIEQIPAVVLYSVHMNEQDASRSNHLLSKSGRRALIRQAHGIEPVVMVGKNGITDELIAACDNALNAHELIKVRFQNFKDECRPLSATIAERSESILVQIIGHVAVLYREHSDPDMRRYSAIVKPAL